MKLSEMVNIARKKRQTFRQVTRTIAAAKTYAEQENAFSNLAERHRETERFNAEKQADQEAGFDDLKAPFLEARQAFHSQVGPFRHYLSTVLKALDETSQARLQTYRTAYHERSTALDEGVNKAAALYREFAPYLRNRQWLQSHLVRIPLPERIAWALAHTFMLLAVMLKLVQTISWSSFLQDDFLVLWAGIWLLALVRWGGAWGLGLYLRRRDRHLFGALHGQYHAFDIVSKQDALKKSLPSVSLDLAVLVAPTPDDDEDQE